MFKKYFTLILTILVINLSLVTTAFSSRKKDEETKFVASRFELKLEKTFSFNDEKIDHVYHREGYRGNLPVSPDSEYFLGKINDSTLYLLNLNSGDTRKVEISHKFEYALFSKDRKRVCLYEFQDKTASVLDLESGRILSTINSPEKIDEVSISPDGERITTGRREVKLIGKQKNAVNLWDANDGRLIASIKGCAETGKLPKFSLDSRFLLLDCNHLKDKAIKLFNAKTGEESLSLRIKGAYGNQGSWLAPNDKTIASIYQFNKIRVWDIASGSLKKEFLGSNGSILDITFSQDGEWFATDGFSPVIRLWNTETGQLLKVLKTDITKSPSFMARVTIAPDGKTLVGIDNKGRTSVWDTETGNLKFALKGNAKKEDLSAQAFFGFKEVLYIYNQKFIKAIDLQTGNVFAQVPAPTEIYYFSSDGNRVFTRDAKGISIWLVNQT